MTVDCEMSVDGEMSVSPIVKSLYTNVYSQAHSQDNQVFAAGTNEGNILVYDIKNILAQEEGEKVEHQSVGPVKRVSVAGQPVYSLAAQGDLLVAGAVGTITGFRWKDLANPNKAIKSTWSITLQADESDFGTPEINSIAIHDGALYAACGDCKTRVYDLSTRRLTDTLEGHTDYVHQVVARGSSVVTCGEDGAVLVWDPRSPTRPHTTLTPHAEASLARPHLGKYISCVDVACGGEWVVCGGGPRAGVWHLRSGGAVEGLPPSDAPVTVARFAGGHDAARIITAGSAHSVRVSSLSGQVVAELPASAAVVYSAALSLGRKQLMTLAGQGTKIDVCLNMNYRDHSLTTDCSHLE